MEGFLCSVPNHESKSSVTPRRYLDKRGMKLAVFMKMTFAFHWSFRTLRGLIDDCGKDGVSGYLTKMHLRSMIVYQ